MVTEIARRAEIGTGQIYRWRREIAVGNGFARLLIAPVGDSTGCPTAPAIAIEFAGKARVRIPSFDTGRVGGGRGQSPVRAMIPIPSGVRVWLAVGHTDMRRGMNSLALQVQEVLQRDPHAGDLYVFRGKRGHLIKMLWHDGIGMSLYAKRLERGRFVWPSPADGIVAISAGATGLYARRHRLAESGSHLAARGGGLGAAAIDSPMVEARPGLGNMR